MENEVNMKNGIVSMISAISLVIASISIALCLGIKTELNSYNNASEDINAVKKIDKALYIASIEDGYVVIRDNNDALVEVLKTPVSHMCDADREYFENDIMIYSENELKALREDFGH